MEVNDGSAIAECPGTLYRLDDGAWRGQGWSNASEGRLMRSLPASYRRDEDMHAARPDTAHLPARWWRHVVARAAHEVQGVVITTEPEAPKRTNSRRGDGGTRARVRRHSKGTSTPI